MDAFYGYFLYVISLVTFGGIYAVLALGLNIQWGFTGLFNVGIAGFFAIGAYVSAILTAPESDLHLGGFGMPLVLAAMAAMAASAIVSLAIGKICIRLRADYLAIATIGIAEIIRLGLKNESWATNGTRGVSQVPKAFETLPEPWSHLGFMTMVLACVFVIYVLLERARTSPWGRVMVAIRENEQAARAAGKDVERLRLQSFVIGSAFMGLGGALMAQYLKFVGPNVSDPTKATFLVWVMLVVGGSANNRGAIVGAFLVWTIWSATEIVTGFLPDEWVLRSAYIRVFAIGLCLQFFLQKYSGGIFPEVRPKTFKPGAARASSSIPDSGRGASSG